MFSDMEVFLVLLAVGFFLLGPVSFGLVLATRGRLKQAEQQILELRQALREATRVAPTPQSGSSQTTTPSQASPNTSEEQPAAEPAAVDTTPAVQRPPVPATPAPAAPHHSFSYPRSPAMASREAVTPPRLAPAQSLEEKLGARWTVWVGGIALGLGALLLVRYSIEQGFFGPAARILLGLAFSVALIAAGEYLRRREPPADAQTLSRALSRARSQARSQARSNVPAILTAAGTVGAFGAIYAAHALYEFIGPAVAFIALGLVGFAAMLAAALHGPALAGLGLIGALTAPLLVESRAPNPWPAVLYLAVTIAFAYALGRLRLWLWLALCAAGGGLLWGFLFLQGPAIPFHAAALVHGIVQTLLATALFVVAAHLDADDEAPLDGLGHIVPSLFAAFVLFALSQSYPHALTDNWLFAAGAVIAILAFGGLRASATAGLTLAAGIALIASLMIWPSHEDATYDLSSVSQWISHFPYPQAASTFASFAAIAASLIALLSANRVLKGQTLNTSAATIYAGGATLIPLAVLSLCYLRLIHAQADLPFAAIAGGMALVFLIAANLFFQREAASTHANTRLGLGAFAAAALSALALGFVFVLDRGMLTVALALSAAAAAFVDQRLRINALRWCVAGLGLIIAARLFYEPRIIGDDLIGTTPVFNWLLWGYGVPALAFGLSASVLQRRGQDIPVLVAQGLSIVFAALLCFFEIRHALNNGDPYESSTGLIEQGLLATTAFAFSIALTRFDMMRTSPVLRFGSFAFAILSFAHSLIGLLLVENPLWSGEPVQGGLFFNALILAYGLPGLLALWLGRMARPVRPDWYWMGERISGLVLLFAMANLLLRHGFQGDDLTLHASRTSDAEIYSYSLLWLATSVFCLAYGLFTRSIISRVASAILMAMTIGKVFFYDLAGLEGVLRALSFIGLGLVLIGIGLVYQKLVFAKPPAQR